MIPDTHYYRLDNCNTMHLQSVAKYFQRLQTLKQLPEISQYIRDNKTKFLILGGGSNVLLPQQYQGIVIKNELLGIEILDAENVQQENQVRIKAYAGEIWDDFVAYTINSQYFGLENLSLIPGTVGAAPIQNIGAYGVQVGDFTESVEVYDLNADKYLQLKPQECNFSYRSSIFKTKPYYLVVAVTFRLLRKVKLNLQYGEIKQNLAKANIVKPTALDVRNCVINIRNSKLPKPKILANVGSFFHNPIVPIAKIEQLKQQFSQLPVYPIDDKHAKISAGYLIDQLGFKGYRQGDVGVYAKQALVLVNYGAATQEQILALADFICGQVYNAYQIELTIEPSIIS